MIDNIKLRQAKSSDAAMMAEIYNHYVLNGTATFEEQALSVSDYEKRISNIITLNLPIIIAENSEAQILGFAYASLYNPRTAYRFTVEDSIYVHYQHSRKGIGRKLLSEIIRLCRESGFKQMMAVIGDSNNKGSINLHKSMGFKEVGIAREVGYKFETWLDVFYMQRTL